MSVYGRYACDACFLLALSPAVEHEPSIIYQRDQQNAQGGISDAHTVGRGPENSGYATAARHENPRRRISTLGRDVSPGWCRPGVSFAANENGWAGLFQIFDPPGPAPLGRPAHARGQSFAGTPLDYAAAHHRLLERMPGLAMFFRIGLSHRPLASPQSSLGLQRKSYLRRIQKPR